MEQLKELERKQSIMSMMQSVGAIDSSDSITAADSNRFLADFILFLMQPCGELDMNRKCKLICEHFPKISLMFLEEGLHLCDKGNVIIEDDLSHHCDDDTGNVPIEDSLSHHCHDDKGLGLLQTDCQDMAMVGLDSMQRANSTLEDFCRSYFMFHGMEANSAESIFKYLPLLSFTESYIYQLDTMNEKLQQFSFGTVPDFDRRPDMVTNSGFVLRLMRTFEIDMFRPLARLLESHGILTERIREELKHGEAYWALERKLCCALTSKQEIQIEDVMKAIHLKSFDYRVLNLLLYQLNGTEINETHMQFLSISEFLVEVSDDLYDYEDDVLENNFNILRMFVRIYGASRAPTFLAKSITEAEEKYTCLLSALDPQLSLKYQKRCEEATKEGGKLFGHPLGTWSIPPVIEDEDLYRYEVSKNTPFANCGSKGSINDIPPLCS